MRTSTARISLTLWTSKTLANGENPIMLAIRFNGQALLSSHFSCQPKHWDEKNECLKRSYSNYAGINKILADMKNQAIAAKLRFETENIPYTAKMIVDAMKPKDLSAKTLMFADIMERLITDRKLKWTTANCYRDVFKQFAQFIGNKYFVITEITDDVIIDYAQYLVNKGVKQNSIIAYFSKISSVIAFANTNGITDWNPKKGLAWVNKNFKKQVHHKAITEDDLAKLRSYYDYQLDKSDMLKRTGKSFALAFYFCSYGLFGLAPIDLIKLKLDNVEETVINDQQCYRINTKRSKTNQPLNIIVPKITFYGEVFKQFYDTANTRDNYIFPILQNEKKSYDYSDDATLARMIKKSETIVNYYLKEICKEIGIQPITMYSARHSFASHQIRQGTNIGLVANALGRSVSGIGCYIANLTKDEELFKLSIM